MKKSVRRMAAVIAASIAAMAMATGAQAATPKLSAKKVTVAVDAGKTVKLKGGKADKWVIKNKKVAKIKKSSKTAAKIVGLKAGKTTLSVKTGEKTLKCTLTVKEAPKISAKKVTLQTGMKKTLKVKGTAKKVKWKSSNAKVATVTPKNVKNAKSAVVKAGKAGKATITAKAGKKKVKCVVTVTDRTIPSTDSKDSSGSSGSKDPTNISGTVGKTQYGTMVEADEDGFTHEKKYTKLVPKNKSAVKKALADATKADGTFDKSKVQAGTINGFPLWVVNGIVFGTGFSEENRCYVDLEGVYVEERPDINYGSIGLWVKDKTQEKYIWINPADIEVSVVGKQLVMLKEHTKANKSNKALGYGGALFNIYSTGVGTGKTTVKFTYKGLDFYVPVTVGE